jgi:hypothetical protein
MPMRWVKPKHSVTAMLKPTVTEKATVNLTD